MDNPLEQPAPDDPIARVQRLRPATSRGVLLMGSGELVCLPFITKNAI